MTVGTPESFWGPYNGDNQATAFPYTGRTFSENDLIVMKRNISTGASLKLTVNLDYTVSGVNNLNGGNVVLFAPLLAGFQLTINRWVSTLQMTDLINQGAFHAQIHEDAFDRMSMVDQQVQEQLERTLTQELTTPYRNLTLDLPVASAFLRYRADLKGVEAVGLGIIPGTMTLGLTGVPFADGLASLNTNASKFAWDNSGFALNLFGTARIKMEGGVYDPYDSGDSEFSVLTSGSTKIPASNQGLRRATWSFYDTKPSDIDNVLLALNVYAPDLPPQPGTYKKTGLHVNAYTMPDNGGDTSGILALQTGGGNAISAFHFTSMRPAGAVQFINNGFAGEFGSTDNNATLLVHAGIADVGDNTQGIILNMGSSNCKGIVIQPAETGGSFDARIAIEVSQYTQGQVNALPTWAVSLAGNQVGNAFSGPTLTSQYSLGPVTTQFGRYVSDTNPYIVSFYKERGGGLSLINDDIIGEISWNGMTDAAKQIAADMAIVLDVTPGVEYGSRLFFCKQAGVLEGVFQLAAPATLETGMLVRCNRAGSFTLDRVKFGAANTGPGGAGRALFIDN